MYYTGKYSFRILVDPFYLHHYASSSLADHSASLGTALQYLKGISECPVSIEFIYPEFVRKHDWKEVIYAYLPNDIGFNNDKQKILNIIKNIPTEPLPAEIVPYLDGLMTELDKFKNKYKQDIKFTKDADGLKNLMKAVEDGSLAKHRDWMTLYSVDYKEILSLYMRYGCDILLTGNNILLSEKQVLTKKHQLFVADYVELRKEIGIFLKGHNIYIDSMATIPIYGLQLPTFYPMTDVNWLKYESLWSTLWTNNNNSNMSEYIRVALFHRYSFLRYSIDQIKFHNQSAKRLVDEKLRSSHYFHMSYHLNAFYLNLWGFLDNIAWAFNYYYNLGYTEQKQPMKVSFSKDEFRKKLCKANPKFEEILNSVDTQNWLDNLSEKRHPAAHREPLFMSPLVDKNTNELISETHVMVKKGNATGLFESLSHLDFDFEKVQELMNKICEHFNVPSIKNPFS